MWPMPPRAVPREPASPASIHDAGALEFLEDNVIHLGTGLGKGRGQDGEGTAVLDVAGGTEEALGLLEGVRIDTAGQNLAGSRLDGVVGAGEAGDGVQEVSA